eukprot:ANDGO_08176.mRNA.1 Nuclear poly(A) polymerase 1
MATPFREIAPSDEDKIRTQGLEDFLRKSGMFESIDERHLREEILGLLDAAAKKCVMDISASFGYQDDGSGTAFGTRIYTFGSFRLGVHSSGADLDTLVIGPNHVERTAFLSHLEKVLREQPGVSACDAVLTAAVPIVKVTWSNVDLDVQYAQMTLARIPQNLDILDPSIIRLCHETSLNSLSGPRVADQLLRLVPNHGTFRTALRAIKLWATKRCIYGNKVGYPGGVAWAIVVARACQFWPTVDASMLVRRFFIFLKEWRWPCPIVLRPLPDPRPGVRNWSPRHFPQDRLHIMPVITPVEPSVNSTFNVSRSTLAVLREEFMRAWKICDSIGAGTSQWDELFEPSDFFSRYKNYIVIKTGGDTADDARRFSDFVQSRLRRLLQQIERMEHVRAHVYPDPIAVPDGPDSASIPFCRALFIGFVVDLPPSDMYREFDITYAISNFHEILMSSIPPGLTGYLGPLYAAVPSKELPEVVRPARKKKAKKQKGEKAGVVADPDLFATGQADLPPASEKHDVAPEDVGDPSLAPPAKKKKFAESEVASSVSVPAPAPVPVPVPALVPPAPAPAPAPAPVPASTSACVPAPAPSPSGLPTATFNDGTDWEVVPDEDIVSASPASTNISEADLDGMNDTFISRVLSAVSSAAEVPK